jgi:hypothetical protein
MTRLEDMTIDHLEQEIGQLNEFIDVVKYAELPEYMRTELEITLCKRIIYLEIELRSRKMTDDEVSL